MNIYELQSKYEGTEISAISAMVMLENAKIPHFQLKLDPAQAVDWIEFQHYKTMKMIDGIGIDKLKEMINIMKKEVTPTE